MRLDLYLVENKIVQSRERAKEHIKNGEVLVGGKVVSKPSYEVCEQDNVVFTGEKLRYVSRGGLKLEKALNVFNINISGKVCMDIGASTGGFTDCMLQNGASHVFAVDVGRSQLAQSLASDSRVQSMEQTNINDTSVDDFIPSPEFISVDVSFVSLKNILPKVASFMNDKCEAVILIKPQFEAGRSNIGKNGIVKDKKVHVSVLNDIVSYCHIYKLEITELDFSPISGGDGNIEYIAHVLPITFPANNHKFDIKDVVQTAFSTLKQKEIGNI